MRFVFVLLLTGAPVMLPSQTENHAAKQPFTIAISSKSPTVKAGSSVWVVVQLTNTSDQGLNASAAFSDLTGVDPNFVFDVRDSRGHLAPKRMHDHPELAGGHVVFRTLPPRGSLTDPADIGRLYDLSQPGKYVIQVSRRASDNPKDGVIKSNKITVTVTP
jgi:hypothetical protein